MISEIIERVKIGTEVAVDSGDVLGKIAAGIAADLNDLYDDLGGLYTEDNSALAVEITSGGAISDGGDANLEVDDREVQFNRAPGHRCHRELARNRV